MMPTEIEMIKSYIRFYEECVVKAEKTINELANDYKNKLKEMEELFNKFQKRTKQEYEEIECYKKNIEKGKKALAEFESKKEEVR